MYQFSITIIVLYHASFSWTFFAYPVEHDNIFYFVGMTVSQCISLLFLQAHAASAVLNFTENCTPEILAPYMDGIVSKLLVLLGVRHTFIYDGFQCI